MVTVAICQVDTLSAVLYVSVCVCLTWLHNMNAGIYSRSGVGKHHFDCQFARHTPSLILNLDHSGMHTPGLSSLGNKQFVPGLCLVFPLNFSYKPLFITFSLFATSLTGIKVG